MQKNKLVVPVLLVVIAMVASACSSTLAALPATTANDVQGNLVEVSQVEARPAEASPAGSPVEPGLLAAYEDTLTSIYEQVNPSVVNIRVVGAESAVVSLPEGMPSIPGLPEVPQSQEPYSQSLGSGFVWDKQGYIITNNHVVEGAQKIEVTFSNDTVVNAELVGNDPDSDLAVIKVDLSPDELQPIQIADSDLVRVGQLAIAIGNPFGLEGTMTVGIVSALGRSLPASEDLTGGPVYSIPDVIQTDAPINPGNSGGVLINASGELIGVTSAIESPVRANAGIGFVIPASIVERVVPQLIENGTFAHPYLGITGISLYPDLAESMDLDKDQKGALVAGVVQDGPADKAGLRGSDRQETIDGIDMAVGGDVILAIDGNPVNDMDDLIAYLSENTAVDQEVTLRVLRDGKEVEI
ncbi:MAG: S1C family serine protease, partial [Anaerolineales bacterium]